MNSWRRYSIFVCFIYGLQEKNSKSEVIFAVCRLPLTSCLTSLISQARLLQIQRETKKDESLQTLKAVIQQGWPDDKSALPSVVSQYFNMRDEMSVQDGLIFSGERVVVPKAARGELLRRIHNSHLGVNGCLNRARECVFGLA